MTVMSLQAECNAATAKQTMAAIDRASTYEALAKESSATSRNAGGGASSNQAPGNTPSKPESTPGVGPSAGDSGSDKGTIIAAVVGGVSGLLLLSLCLGVLLCWCCRRKRAQSKGSSSAGEVLSSGEARSSTKGATSGSLAPVTTTHGSHLSHSVSHSDGTLTAPSARGGGDMQQNQAYNLEPTPDGRSGFGAREGDHMRSQSRDGPGLPLPPATLAAGAGAGAAAGAGAGYYAVHNRGSEVDSVHGVVPSSSSAGGGGHTGGVQHSALYSGGSGGRGAAGLPGSVQQPSSSGGGTAGSTQVHSSPGARLQVAQGSSSSPDGGTGAALHGSSGGAVTGAAVQRYGGVGSGSGSRGAGTGTAGRGSLPSGQGSGGTSHEAIALEPHASMAAVAAAIGIGGPVAGGRYSSGSSNMKHGKDSTGAHVYHPLSVQEEGVEGAEAEANAYTPPYTPAQQAHSDGESAFAKPQQHANMPFDPEHQRDYVPSGTDSNTQGQRTQSSAQVRGGSSSSGVRARAAAPSGAMQHQPVEQSAGGIAHDASAQEAAALVQQRQLTAPPREATMSPDMVSAVPNTLDDTAPGWQLTTALDNLAASDPPQLFAGRYVLLRERVDGGQATVRCNCLVRMHAAAYAHELQRCVSVAVGSIVLLHALSQATLVSNVRTGLLALS